jgi:hypothetical protein
MFDGATLSAVRGLTWEQIATATVRDGDRTLWQDETGDREALGRLLPDDVTVPASAARTDAPAPEIVRQAQGDGGPPSS